LYKKGGLIAIKEQIKIKKNTYRLKRQFVVKKNIIIVDKPLGFIVL